MKIIVTGSKGQLGTDLLNELSVSYPKDEVFGLDLPECDLTNYDQVFRLVCKIRPDVIIHLAAYTAVDKAEIDPIVCYRVNALGTSNVAHAALAVNAAVLYISTDYVFNGLKKSEYEPFDEKLPLSVYGMSKALGEEAVLSVPKHFILRTSWVFGKNGSNFVYTMIKLAESGRYVSVVNDQIGSPTYTKDLSILISEMAHSTKYGIYHGTNEGFISWYQFACMIFEKAGYNEKDVHPIPTAIYKCLAKRPLNSRLDKSCLDQSGFKRLPSIENALDRFMFECGLAKGGGKK
jgi:dTDP-4-dehydrorhamnose reductase